MLGEGGLGGARAAKKNSGGSGKKPTRKPPPKKPPPKKAVTTGGASAPPSGPPTPPAVAAPGGGGYQRTNVVAHAENFACGLGVANVQYEDQDAMANDPAVIYEISNNCNEALDALRARGIQEVPRRIETCQLYFTATSTRSGAWAVYIHNPMMLSGLLGNWMRLNRTILINPRPEWANVAQEVQRRYQGGEISTGDPHHFLYHELGHFLWREDHPKRNEPADNQAVQAALPTIQAHVSGRATANAAEFVSEVFAQKVVGTLPVNPDVDKLYQQLGRRMI